MSKVCDGSVEDVEVSRLGGSLLNATATSDGAKKPWADGFMR